MNFFIELNSTYFFENIKNIKSMTGCKVAPVLKSNAYGHGLKEIIFLLQFVDDISHVCVAYIEEAEDCLRYDWKKKIIIMIPNEIIIWHEQYEFFLISFNFLNLLLEYAKKNKVIFSVHIKINLGLNRFGFDSNEIDILLEILKKNRKYINVVGVASHFSDLNYSLNSIIYEKIYIFNSIIDKISSLYGNNIFVHPFSSKGANIIKKVSNRINMVRVGALLYGSFYYSDNESLDKNNNTELKKLIKQVLVLKAKIISVRACLKGETLGYDLSGSSYKINNDKQIIIAAFGYGSGYSCGLSNGYIAGVYKGFYMSILGMAGMNNIYFDASFFDGRIEEGDYIILTHNDYPLIQSAYLSCNHLKKREQVFTAMLHPTITKIIV